MTELNPCRVCNAVVCLEHCVYCGIDCSPALGLAHTPECPRSTGVYPPEPDSLCSRCKASLDDQPTMQIEIAPDVVEVVCVGCAATSAGLTA